MDLDDAISILAPTNPIDDLAIRYRDIGEEIKRLDADRDALRIALMAYNGQDGEKFRVSVTEYTSDRLESLKAIRDKSPALFDMLHEAGCVKETVASRLSIKEIK